VTHQVPQCGLRLADNVIVTVVVLIKDCEPDGQGVVIVTKLGHGNIDQLPTWVQIVLNRLSLAYLFEVICSFRGRSAKNKVWVTLGPEVTICQILSLEANFNHRLIKSHSLQMLSLTIVIRAFLSVWPSCWLLSNLYSNTPDTD